MKIQDNKPAQPKRQAKQFASLQNTHKGMLVELEKYKLLVDSVADYAIFLLNPEGVVVSWNRGAERIKGYKPHEIIGQHFSKFYTQHDIDVKKPERELEIVKRLGRIEDEDWRVRKDGSRFWANVIITGLFSPSGELVGFAKVTRDLTERKRQEDELRKANVQLRKQQAGLEQLNASKDEFISLASHQLRTPATIVKQLIGLLLAGFVGELTPAQIETLQKAHDSNERQISIVNSLLEVAQIDAGKVTLRKVPVDVARMLQDIIDEQKGIIGSRRQTISLHADKDLSDIEVDPKYFRMALENIIDNASKYTRDAGSIAVTIHPEGSNVVIRIADTGVGIAAEDLHNLFTKFNRIPNELSQQVSGSGLGLYWVWNILQLHGGNVSAESELGRGTTFIITVPLENDHA